MKRFFLLSTIIISSFGMMSAQTTNEAPAVKAKKMVAKVNTSAPLQGAQWSQVNTAFVDFYTKQDALDAQKATLTPADYASKTAALKATRDAAIKASLSPEQLKAWSAVADK